MRGVKRFLAGSAMLFALAAPAPASAGSIAGTVTAEGGGPIEGVEVCARPSPEAFEGSCAETNSAGRYSLANLPASAYLIRFSGERNNLKYVSELYDDARYSWEMEQLHLAATQEATVDAELAEGGSIAGTLTDEGTGLPVAGMRACATDPQGIPMRCSFSETDGTYLLNGLPSDVYTVEYESGNGINYLTEHYEDADTWAEATHFTIEAPEAISAIDAELAPGGQIFGHVSDVTTGVPVQGVFVCAFEREPGEYQECAYTDSAGNYALRSLPAADYLVGFEPEYYPWGVGADQWWEGAETAAEADPIAIEPPQSRTGIDGQVVKPSWPPSPGPEEAILPTALPPLPPPAAAKKPPRKCKKGFRRKLVKGKRRCVRKHKHKHHRRQKGGRRS